MGSGHFVWVMNLDSFWKNEVGFSSPVLPTQCLLPSSSGGPFYAAVVGMDSEAGTSECAQWLDSQEELEAKEKCAGLQI